MRPRLKIGAALAVTALVVAGVVAGVALADGGRAPQRSTTAAPGASWAETKKAANALASCARKQGLDAIASRLVAGDVTLQDVSRALASLDACRPQLNAFSAAIRKDATQSRSVLRGAALESARCLDRRSVRLADLASALLGDQASVRKVQAAADACLPLVPALTR